MSNHYDTIVIGAGQGLASAHYLQRANSKYLVLDGGTQIGESWRRRWDSLRRDNTVRKVQLDGGRMRVSTPDTMQFIAGTTPFSGRRDDKGSPDAARADLRRGL